ncbi:MAG: ABC transporter transmembrane domain-containing protein [Bacillota bacterium]|nr:ABC transporter transmembrane domain-containing protein [Bacillota bacterium]
MENKYQEKEIVKSFDLEIIKRLYKYLKPQLPKFILCLILIVGITSVDLSIPYFIKVAIDDNITAYDIPMAVTEKKINEASIKFENKFYTRESNLIKEKDYSYKTILKSNGNYYLINGRVDINSKDVEEKFTESSKLKTDEYQIFRKSDKKSLIDLSIILVIILVLKLLFSFLNMYILYYASQKIIYHLREDLFEHVQLLPLEFFDKNPTGRLVTRVTNDMKKIAELFTTVLVTSLKDVFLIIGTIVVMISINYKLALVSLSTVPIVIIISYIFRIKARKIQRLVKKRLASINATLAENINGMKIIQMFNREDYVYEEFKNINNKYLKASVKETKLFAIFKPSMNVIYSISIALIIYYGGGLSIENAIEVGVIVAFVQYINQFFKPIFDLAEKFNIFQSAMASSERVFLMLDEKNDILEKEDYQEFGDSFRGDIEFKNVSFAYDKEYVLKNINFKVKAGETIALVGATGSGKTTITSLINRFYDLNKGQILIDNIDIKNLKKKNLREKIGMVLQDVFLFAGDMVDCKFICTLFNFFNSSFSLFIKISFFTITVYE